MADTGTSTAAEATRRPSYGRRVLAPLTQGDFRWYWAGTSTQSISQGMQFLVLGWLVLEVTDSATQLGLVLFMYGIPNVGFLLLGGIIADRYPRRIVLIFTQAAVGVLIAALAALSMTGVVELWHIYAVSALLGVVQALNMPARVALAADLVDPKSLLDAVALVNAAVHAGRIIGPPMGGLIIEIWGIGPSLFANSAFYFVSVACLHRIGSTSQKPAESPPHLWRNLVEGFAYVRSNPMVLTVLVIICAFGGFGMSHQQVIPAFVKESLDSGAAAAGTLLLASGIGSLIGNVLLTTIGQGRMYRWLLICLVVFAVSLTLFAWASWFWVAWGLFLVVGIFGLGMSWPLATTILQLETPPEVRGRVMGLLHFTPGFHYLGALPLALLAGVMGWGAAIGIAAGLCLAVTVWFGMLRSNARKLVRAPA